MSITPIELYAMVPKSQEAGQLRHGEMTRDISQQAEAAQQFDRNISDNSQKTVRMKESDTPEYSYDKKDGQGSGRGFDSEGRKREKSKDPEQPKIRGYMGPGGIDIRI